jgi:hypothetical protein
VSVKIVADLAEQRSLIRVEVFSAATVEVYLC